ncbi:MAG: hypothetical protein LBK22_04200 [Tannerella sp.]|nr:hypothetical protein [Tannerella sp.]
MKVDEKSSAITAMPKLLEALTGAIQICRIVIAKAKPEAIQTPLLDCFAAGGSQ